jgi:aspartyl-tRNA synthetase
MDGKEILLRARVHNLRLQGRSFRMTFLTMVGSKIVFYELRQQTDTIQALLVQSANEVSKQMYKFAASINPESIILVKGIVKKSPIEIIATSVKDAELHITHVLN